MSMNNLNGSLETFSAVDILHLLARTGARGALHLRNTTNAVGVVFCAEGAVTLAARRPTDGVGDTLVRAGFLTPDELKAATSEADAGSGLARTLATKGTDPERLLGYLRHQTEEALFELAQWVEGAFDFQADAVHGLDEAFRYPIEDLLAAVEKRNQSWARLQEQLPSLDAPVAHVVMLPGDDDQLSITRSQYRVLSAINGQRTARNLADHLGDGIYETCRVLGGLHGAGLIRFGPEGDGGGPAPAPASATRDAAVLDLSVGTMQSAAKEAQPAAARRAEPAAAAARNGVNGHGATSVAAPSTPAATNGKDAQIRSLNGHSNGHANGHSNGSANGHPSTPNGAPSTGASGTVASVPFRSMPGAPDVSFQAPGEKPDRAVLLKLLSAVKDLEVSEKG